MVIYCVVDISYYSAASTFQISMSHKCRNFVEEPMGDKAVTELAGIGEALGRRLASQGFTKACDLLGRYLVLKKNKDMFKAWLSEACGANDDQQEKCYNCLDQWCNNFMLT